MDFNVHTFVRGVFNVSFYSENEKYTTLHAIIGF